MQRPYFTLKMLPLHVEQRCADIRLVFLFNIILTYNFYIYTFIPFFIQKLYLESVTFVIPWNTFQLSIAHFIFSKHVAMHGIIVNESIKNRNFGSSTTYSR